MNHMGTGLWMHRKNFITGEHGVNRKRLRPWTVYELVTTCPGQYFDSGHVLPKSHESKLIEGHESIPSKGYDSTLVWTVP